MRVFSFAQRWLAVLSQCWLARVTRRTQLVKAAEAHQADLLVLGQRGHSALWGRLISTTAERAGRHAACSVLIMRHGQDDNQSGDQTADQPGHMTD